MCEIICNSYAYGANRYTGSARSTFIGRRERGRLWTELNEEAAEEIKRIDCSSVLFLLTNLNLPYVGAQASVLGPRLVQRNADRRPHSEVSRTSSTSPCH